MNLRGFDMHGVGPGPSWVGRNIYPKKAIKLNPTGL